MYLDGNLDRDRDNTDLEETLIQEWSQPGLTMGHCQREAAADVTDTASHKCSTAKLSRFSGESQGSEMAFFNGPRKPALF